MNGAPIPTEQLRARYYELVRAQDEGRALDAAERRTLRWLRRQPGVHQPAAPSEFAAIAAARLKRRRRGERLLAAQARRAARDAADAAAPHPNPPEVCD